MTFQSGLKEETENLPASLLGLIDDSINEYTDAMRTDFTGHKRSSNFIRQLNSIVDILIGLNDLEQNKSYMTRLNKEKEEQVKKIHVLHHVNGKIKFKGNLLDNEYHGLGFLNHYNGNLMYRGNFVRGEIDGTKCEIFNFNGNLKYRGQVVLGAYDGDGVLYHENGCLKYKGNFHQNSPHQDQATLFYDNGNIEYQGKIIDGFYQDNGAVFHRNGNLEYEGEFVDGGPDGLRCKIFYENGRVRYAGGCKAGMYHGKGILWAKRNYIEYDGNFHEGKQVDEYKRVQGPGETQKTKEQGAKETEFGSKQLCNYYQDKTYSESSPSRAEIDSDPNDFFDYPQGPIGETFYAQRFVLSPIKNKIDPIEEPVRGKKKSPTKSLVRKSKSPVKRFSTKSGAQKSNDDVEQKPVVSNKKPKIQKNIYSLINNPGIKKVKDIKKENKINNNPKRIRISSYDSSINREDTESEPEESPNMQPGKRKTEKPSKKETPMTKKETSMTKKETPITKKETPMTKKVPKQVDASYEEESEEGDMEVAPEMPKKSKLKPVSNKKVEMSSEEEVEEVYTPKSNKNAKQVKAKQDKAKPIEESEDSQEEIPASVELHRTQQSESFANKYDKSDLSEEEKEASVRKPAKKEPLKETKLHKKIPEAEASVKEKHQKKTSTCVIEKPKNTKKGPNNDSKYTTFDEGSISQKPSEQRIKVKSKPAIPVLSTKSKSQIPRAVTPVPKDQSASRKNRSPKKRYASRKYRSPQKKDKENQKPARSKSRRAQKSPGKSPGKKFGSKDHELKKGVVQVTDQYGFLSNAVTYESQAHKKKERENMTPNGPKDMNKTKYQKPMESIWENSKRSSRKTVETLNRTSGPYGYESGN